MPEHYDVIVIGSGAGGGTLTHALAPTGARVLLLERGGWMPREVQNWDPRSIWADLRYRNSGKWIDEGTGREFTPEQHYYVGGNTKVYGAVLFRFRERDFGEVRHVDGVSPAWPISYDDLEPWYTRAERLYYVHGERGTDPFEPPASGPYPYPSISHEPRIERLMSDLSGAGLAPFPLPTGIMIDDVVVLSAGAINSAALLLAPANERHPDGLGNGSGMVGRSDEVTIGFDAPDAEDPAEIARHSLDFRLTTEDLPRSENRGRRPPERHHPLRRRPGRLGARPRLPDARAGQPLRGRLQPLRVEHRGEPDAHDHRQRPPGGRPHRRAARRPRPDRGARVGVAGCTAQRHRRGMSGACDGAERQVAEAVGRAARGDGGPLLIEGPLVDPEVAARAFAAFALPTCLGSAGLPSRASP
jgi:hypothetical protein